MQDMRKTKRQLIAELTGLRSRASDLEKAQVPLKAAEAGLAEELKKFQALYELAVAMTVERTLDENLSLVVAKARELLNAEASYIALCDDEAGDVYMHTISGIRTEAFLNIRVPLGSGLGGRVAATGKGIVVEDYFREIEPLLHDIVRREGLTSGLAVPIQMVHRNLGVLYAFNRTATTFKASDLDTLALLGNLAAMEITRHQTSDALRLLCDDLERRVKERVRTDRLRLEKMVEKRTTELQRANELLMLEIAERKKADEALRHNEEMLSNILSLSPMGISYFEDGRVKWTNHVMTEMFGENDEAEYRNKTPREFYATEQEYKRVRELFFRSLAQGKPSQVDAKFRRKDGSTFDGQINISALDRAHPRKGTITTVFDISPRKQAEKALREGEERYRSLYDESVRAQELYRSLLNSCADAIVVYDLEGRAKYVSESFTDMFGWTMGEVEGRQVPYVPESERTATMRRVEGVLREGIPGSGFETKRLTKSGEILDVSISASRYHDHEGKPAGILVIVRDISEQKQAEEALAQSEKQLRLLSAQLLTAQEKERKRVARELHDGIGQSLTAIKFRLENAVKQANRAMGSESIQSLEALIPVIQAAIEEVRRISMDLRPSTLDDLGILATITWFCREFQAVYSGIRIEKRIEMEEDQVREPLKIVIFRILQEALNNVAKHSRADCICVCLWKTGDTIELTIRDNGVGFDRDLVAADVNCGRGFGLASMRERAESLGGTFRAATDDEGWMLIQASWPDE